MPISADNSEVVNINYYKGHKLIIDADMLAYAG